MSHRSGITVFVFLWRSYFSWENAGGPDFLPLRGSVIFHWICTAHLLYSLITEGHLSCSPLLAAVNTGAATPAQAPALDPFGYMSRVELVNHMVVLGLIFWGSSMRFSTAAAPLYILKNSGQGRNFSTYSRHLFSALINFMTAMAMGLSGISRWFWLAFSW